MKIKPLLVFLFIPLIMLSSACQQTDIIGNTALGSFETLIKFAGEQVTENRQTGFFVITAPDKSATFSWSQDFSKTTDDILMTVDVQPFLAAGLDVTKLPVNMVLGDKILIRGALSDQAPKDSGTNPLAAFQQIVNNARDHIGYHADMDHFGISFGDGNAFEWAKDIKTNDKDMVFVLDSQPLIAAGADPDKLEGWVYSDVNTMESNGRPITVKKFLKPFNLK